MKGDFKALRNDLICDERVKYFDFTASALALKSIEEQMQKLLANYANIHSASGKNSLFMSQQYAAAKGKIRGCLGLGADYALIAAGSGATAAIKRFCEIAGIFAPPAVRARMSEHFGADFGRKFADTLVICSALEHHSNELAYRSGLCDFARLSLREFSSDLFELRRRCKDFRRAHPAGRLIIAASAASNITGVRNDLAAMAAIAREFGAVFFVDATAALAYENLAVLPDAFAFSAHKFCGGCGAPGFLAIKKSLLSELPTFAGGGTVEYVDRSSAEFFADAELREEAGTPDILGVIKASLAIAHRDALGLAQIAEKMQQLKQNFLQEFLKITFAHKITLYAASARDRLPIFALNAAGINPFELAAVLAKDFGIESRAGCACAGPYTHDLMQLSDGAKYAAGGGKPGFLRLGLHYAHESDDIAFLLDALVASCKKLRK